MVVLKNVCGVHPYSSSREYYGFCPPNPIFRNIPALLFFDAVFVGQSRVQSWSKDIFIGCFDGVYVEEIIGQSAKNSVKKYCETKSLSK
ncbi:MAG: hypothetical protein CL916_10690 [Deltaproteobacteria bacterium]|nr:hypothetical protein [Deltaproteobacteria bacterium]